MYVSKLRAQNTVNQTNNVNAREIRRFRSYLSELNGSSSHIQQTKIFVNEAYSFYGNAEVISPADRRRFRESEAKRKTKQIRELNSTPERSREKISLCSKKQGLHVFKFSPLSTIRNRLSGTNVRFQLFAFRESKVCEVALTSPKSTLVDDFNTNFNVALPHSFYNNTKKGLTKVDSIKQELSFNPAFFISNTQRTAPRGATNVAKKAISIKTTRLRRDASRKQIKLSDSHNLLSKENVPYRHLFSFESLFSVRFHQLAKVELCYSWN